MLHYTHTHTHTHTYTHPIWPTYCTGHSLFVMAGSKLWSSESAHDAAARLVSFTKSKQTHNCALPETLTREHHELLHCTHTEHSWCDASPVRTGFTTPPKPRVRRWNTRLSFRHGCTFFLQIQNNVAFFFLFCFVLCDQWESANPKNLKAIYLKCQAYLLPKVLQQSIDYHTIILLLIDNSVTWLELNRYWILFAKIPPMWLSNTCDKGLS